MEMAAALQATKDINIWSGLMKDTAMSLVLSDLKRKRPLYTFLSYAANRFTLILSH